MRHLFPYTFLVGVCHLVEPSPLVARHIALIHQFDLMFPSRVFYAFHFDSQEVALIGSGILATFRDMIVLHAILFTVS